MLVMLNVILVGLVFDMCVHRCGPREYIRGGEFAQSFVGKY